MRLYLLFILFLFLAPKISAQDVVSINEKSVDSLYKEDQFYIGVTYNLIANKPDGLSQNGFSGGFHFGYTKDMPINNKRNKAIGIGLGLSLNSFNQNMLINETGDNTNSFQIIDDTETNFSKNKFSTYMLELPIEYRWRTSTAESYKFWRIYTGFKVSYVLYNSSKYEGAPENIKLSNIDTFNSLQYGAFISGGYNTWNMYFYYGLNSIFKSDAKLNNEVIDANAIKIGLMFYIL